jgi:lipopolysaccharide export system protein LptA
MLIVGAGVLLVASLVVFLAVGKWKNPFNRRDLPQRLGFEIQQEANGVTFSHALGAHSQFKIHASKVVQLKQGNALLHDVKIELYGEDGSRVDRIEGDEFEYDQQAGTAKATGPVEITLMRPGVAPAIAPKAAAGRVAGDKPKGSPVVSAVEAAKQGEIHVKTSGLTFDQHSGVATTGQHVIFSMAQGGGSSMGATFDSQQGLLVLDRLVELTAKRGAATIQIHAQHAEFERETQVCRLRAVTAEYQGGEAAAGDAKVLFREDGSAVRLDAMNGFTLTTAAGGHVAAPTGQMDFDEHNQPRHGLLQGGVTMDSTGVSGAGDGLRRRQLHGSAPTANLEFNVQGKLRHAHLERGVAIDSEELSQSAGQPQRLSRHWRSPVADVDFRDSGHGQIEPVAMRGSGGVVVTGESQRGNGAVAPSRLSADEVTGEFGAGSRLTVLHGNGHASIDETTATGARQATSGDRLDAHFAESAQAGEKPGAKGGTAGEDELQSAEVDGHVTLTQQPAPKPGALPPAPLRATAGRAVYEAAGEWLHLTLNPRVEDGALQLTASKVDVSRVSGDAFAHGNVKASWNDASGGSNGRQAIPAASQGGVALGGQGPAHVIAAEAELRQATGEATFSGQARLWQQANSIAAPVIVLDRGRQTLVARTTDRAEPVRAVLVTAAGVTAAPEAGNDAGKQVGKSSQPAVIRVRGGDLRYSDAERKALMHGGVLGSVTAETGTATSSSDQIEVALLPVGKAAPGQAQVDHMTARGHVVLTSEGRRGTGEQLVYTSATNEYVLTGTATAPPRMTDSTRGTVSGEALIFRGRDDSVSVEGGSSKTTTQTTAPK